MDEWEQVICEYLGSFPTYYCSSKPERSCSSGRLLVFSNKDEVYENDSYSSDDAGTRKLIYKRIISAFSKMDKFVCRYGTIVQFWAPVTIGGKHQLSTSGQPFAVNWLAPYLKKYREHCVSECKYDIDVNSTFRGIPASAFLNRFPEIVFDTKNHHESSLMRYASDCKLHTSYTLPIGCPQYHSSCIGVVECSSLSPINLEFVNTMKRALEQEGLNVFNVQDWIPYNVRIPYNTINGLRDEIQVALKSVCESHKIGVAQVWISYEDENHVPFSFSSGDTQTTRRLALKLTGYNSVDEDSTACHLRFKEYCDVCDMVPLKMGKELVEKTLQDYQPRFCEDISQLDTDTLMAWVSTDVACSGFTICTSIDTGDFSCAFEFIWHHNPKYVCLLKALLLTLESHLPRFKFASGAELDQLDVLHVQFFKIFEEKRKTKEITLSRDQIEKHYGKTEKQAANELQVSVSTLKRKCKQLGIPGWQGPLQQKKMYNPNKNQGNESQTHQKDIGVIQDPSPVRNEITVIKADYAGDIIMLHLPISEATFVTVKNQIGARFKLGAGTFTIKFLDKDEDWIFLTSDQDLSYCIQDSRNVDRSSVKLRVFLHNQ